ncbi:hypothetical protein [Desulfitobacterium hafniense]|uniref:Spo0E like sporulation regulatory protein n=2 Tax=Desulfitobacterium hafniense TaxID=49338 RepID=G9XJQ2_DESHA|nr:hypothetical protein [Desulfitobacterium hafniense]ACL18574.1 hypothetical protein Dhaf_0507 [Desulfitobacterium hafniense DCB-2]EHL08090.1 hypothetical protein HMPREF0322_01183 [Desulfitobacterium hafniense DP7]
MKDALLNEKLENERKKLSKLADEAWQRGVPLIQDKNFMVQNQKVDALVLKYMKEYVNR